MLGSDKFRRQYTSELKDPILREFWTVQFPQLAANPRDSGELVGSSLNKISRFLTDPLMRRIVSQSKTAFNIRDIMDRGHILLVNLSKGALGEENSALLGAVLVNQILSAALQRRHTPRAERRLFHLVVDEYQNFATTSFPVLQSEARKYAIDVIVAHQFRDQLDDLNKGSTMNVANFICFRTSGRDSFELASQFDNTPPKEEPEVQPVYERVPDSDYVVEAISLASGERLKHFVDPKPRSYGDVQAQKANDLATLDDYEANVRIMRNGRIVQGNVQTYPFNPPSDKHTADYIRRESLKKGRDYRDIDAEVEPLKDVEFTIPSDEPPGYRS